MKYIENNIQDGLTNLGQELTSLVTSKIAQIENLKIQNEQLKLEKTKLENDLKHFEIEQHSILKLKCTSSKIANQKIIQLQKKLKEKEIELNQWKIGKMSDLSNKDIDIKTI